MSDQNQHLKVHVWVIIGRTAADNSASSGSYTDYAA